jgi:hypothetical protein
MSEAPARLHLGIFLLLALLAQPALRAQRERPARPELRAQLAIRDCQISPFFRHLEHGQCRPELLVPKLLLWLVAALAASRLLDIAVVAAAVEELQLDTLRDSLPQELLP